LRIYTANVVKNPKSLKLPGSLSFGLELDGQDQVQIIVTRALNCSLTSTNDHMIRPRALIMWSLGLVSKLVTTT
jgi:hypothetical protein